MGSSSTKHFHHHSLMSFQTRNFSLIFSKYDVLSSCARIRTIYIIRRMFHLKSYYDRIIKVRRVIRKLLFELPAQSRCNYGGSCSGLCQILAVSRKWDCPITKRPLWKTTVGHLNFSSSELESVSVFVMQSPHDIVDIYKLWISVRHAWVGP